MSILKEIDELIEKWESQGVKNDFKPKKTTIEKIGKMNVKLMERDLWDFMYEICELDELNFERMYYTFTHLHPNNVRFMNKETKQTITEEIERLIGQINASNFEASFFPSRFQMKRDRLRLLTSGEKLEEYIFLEESEADRLYTYIQNIFRFSMKYYLLDEDCRNDIFANVLDYTMKVYKNGRTHCFTKSWIKENIRSHASTMMEKIKKWYKKTDQDFLEEIKKNPNAYRVSHYEDYFYLMEKNEIEEMKEKMMKQFETQINSLKTSREKSRLSDAKELKQRMERVMTWNS